MVLWTKCALMRHTSRLMTLPSTPSCKSYLKSQPNWVNSTPMPSIASAFTRTYMSLSASLSLILLLNIPLLLLLIQTLPSQTISTLYRSLHWIRRRVSKSSQPTSRSSPLTLIHRMIITIIPRQSACTTGQQETIIAIHASATSSCRDLLICSGLK